MQRQVHPQRIARGAMSTFLADGMIAAPKAPPTAPPGRRRLSHAQVAVDYAPRRASLQRRRPGNILTGKTRPPVEQRCLDYTTPRTPRASALPLDMSPTSASSSHRTMRPFITGENLMVYAAGLAV